MTEAARLGATPLLRGLPDDIVICEILVRLDTKSLLRCPTRCRAVCCSWRRVTIARDFLLFHHGRQPSLPILYGYCCVGDEVKSIDIIPFDHHAGLAAADQLQSVARLDHVLVRPEASCDGLLVLSFMCLFFTICNPSTRYLFGMYLHLPTGEYRLLMYSWESTNLTFLSHTRTKLHRHQIGLPRYIESADTDPMKLTNTSVLFHGCLHWDPMRHGSDSNMITVFDITIESFRLMRAPVFPSLFEMDGMLGMFSCNDANTIIDIWVLQEYKSEDWILKCQIKLPVTEIRALCENLDDDDFRDVVGVDADGELLVLVRFAEWLLQVGMDSKLVATFHHKGIHPTEFQLKQSLVPHAFFPSLEGYAVNDWPFM
ncbi:hypothetical protein VPH35_055433 [Triticum aestivum]